MDHQMVSNNVKGQEKYSREATCDNIKTLQQAGAELCQAQLKLGLDFNHIVQVVPKLAIYFLFAHFSGSKASNRNEILGTTHWS